jgi:ABC-type multidrug transport system fused ATPase/permease subunit
VGVGGVTPERAVTRWPGAIAYVPQDIVLVEGTIRENVALGLPPSALHDDQILDALGRAHFNLADLAQSEGLDTRIGEGGERLSGGQRQRLGLARAFLTRPKLIVLDEATSSLDAETEFLIGEALRELHGLVTVIVIAHRLSTVKDSDQVAYLEAGELKALGTFEEVKASQANFARQAHLLGL